MFSATGVSCRHECCRPAACGQVRVSVRATSFVELRLNACEMPSRQGGSDCLIETQRAAFRACTVFVELHQHVCEMPRLQDSASKAVQPNRSPPNPARQKSCVTKAASSLPQKDGATAVEGLRLDVLKLSVKQSIAMASEGVGAM